MSAGGKSKNGGGGGGTFANGQFQPQFPTSAAGGKFPPNQQASFESSAQQPLSNMSSQVANGGYSNQMGTMPSGQAMNNSGNCIPPNYGGPSGMNPMGMNGMPPGYQQQMSIMNSAGARPMAWQQNGMMAAGNNAEFHPMYHNGQAGMNTPMMYGGQPPNLNAQATQTPPPSAGGAPKKVGQKRKNAQQNGANAAGGRTLKQPPFMPPQMQPNGMPGQHFQQFPQSAQMFNNQGGQHINGPMNSAQFNAPNPQMNHMNSYPNNMPNNFDQHAQWAANQQKRPSSESVRQELRTTVRARQNASSPSAAANVPSTVTPNEMNGPRFPPNIPSATPPNLTSPQRMNGMQQPGGLQQPPMYRNMPLQQQLPMNGGMFPPQPSVQPNSQHPLSNEPQDFDFDQDFKPALFYSSDALHLDDIYDWKITSGRFDLNNEETMKMVQKMLS